MRRVRYCRPVGSLSEFLLSGELARCSTRPCQCLHFLRPTGLTHTTRLADLPLGTCHSMALGMALNIERILQNSRRYPDDMDVIYTCCK